MTVNPPGAGTPTGTVTVDDGDGHSCSADVADGTCSLASTTPGTSVLTATYSGDADFNGSSDTDSHFVGSGSTTTTITDDTPDPTVVGQSYDVAWTVTVDSPATGTPTGTVTVDDGDGNTCSAAVAGGTCNLTSTSSGSKTLTATYSGDVNFNGSLDSTSHDVDPADTTTTITDVSPVSTVVGQAYDVTWSVTVDGPGAGIPTGTVTVDDGDGNTCSAAVADGVCSLASTSSGTKTLTATYEGDANFNDSFGTTSHQVDAADTATTITNAAGLGSVSSVTGEAYSVAVSVAAVAPGAGTPGGTVNLSDGSATCVVTLGGGSGSCLLTSTTAGAKTITAAYAGTSDFGTSSTTTAHQVGAGNTTTTIVSDSPDPTFPNQSYTIGWTVTVNAPALGIPTGTVTVSDGQGGTCSALVAAGSCSLSTSTAGAKTITAAYSGDSNLTGSSDGEAHSVSAGSTTTTITGDAPDPSVVGQAYTVNWSVAVDLPATGTPTGTVTVSDGSQTCSAAVGAGTCVLTSTSAGAKTITATYSGDSNFGGSVGSTSHTVNAASTATTITSDTPDPSVVGQPYAVNVTVAAQAPGAGTPAGTVNVSDGSANCTVTLAGGTGSCNLTSTTAGAKTLSATYAGSANFAASNGTAPHQVNAASTATTINSDTPDPSLDGQPYAVSVTVAAQAPGAGTPTGTVNVSDGTVGCVATLSGGTGSCNLTSTGVGAKTLTATYVATANFAASTSAGAAHQVDPSSIATTTTITSHNPDPSIIGQTISVAVSVTATSGTPAGTVAVSDGTVSCNVTLSGGTGSCNLTPTSAGPKTLTASFPGDSTYSSSIGTAAHSVFPSSSTTSIVSDGPDPSVTGQPYLVQLVVAPVAPGSGSPTGTVVVTDGSASCNATLSSGGGTCILTSTTSGAKTLTATYMGSFGYGASAGSTGHQVNAASTTTTITSDTPDPSNVGQAYAVGVSVVTNAPGAGTPTGTVNVSDGSVNCTATLSGGTGSCNLTSTSGGAKTLSATYAGSADFAASNGTTGHTVNGTPTTTTIQSDTPDPSVIGQSYNVAVNVASGSGTPTGTVTVSDGTASCNATLSGGNGSCSLPSSSAGSKTLTASYPGTATFQSSSAVASHQVNPGSTTTTITATRPTRRRWARRHGGGLGRHQRSRRRHGDRDGQRLGRHRVLHGDAGGRRRAPATSPRRRPGPRP